VCVCFYEHMHVCMNVYVSVCACARVLVHAIEQMDVCVHVCLYVCTSVRVCVTV